MSERRPIPGYAGTYEITSDGRVWSIPRPRTKGGWRSLRQNKRGYLSLTLVANGVQTTHEIHRLLALTYLGAPLAGQEVRHLNGDPIDNRLDNLAYGSRAENVQDAIRHGTNVSTAKTACPQGHPYDAANTRLYRGRRYCKACQRARSHHPDYDPTWSLT